MDHHVVCQRRLSFLLNYCLCAIVIREVLCSRSSQKEHCHLYALLIVQPHSL